MAEIRPDVTDAELNVLQALWARGEATIRDITDELYPDGGVSHYATVQKLLERLEAKRCVARERVRGRHVFHPRVARTDLIDHELREVADRLCEGSVTPILTQLVKGRRLSKSERDALRALVEDLDREKRGRGKGRGGKS